MTDIFGRLSPIVDSEDECMLELSRSHLRIVLKYESGFTFEMAPWIDITDMWLKTRSSPAVPVNEVAVQTQPTHGPLIDKYLQTDEIVCKDICLQVEPRSKYTAEYENSAEDRVLQCLSTMFYSKELIKYFTSTVSEVIGCSLLSRKHLAAVHFGIEIKPITPTSRIIDVYCDNETFHYVILLARVETRALVVEIWSMRNLLHPTVIETNLRINRNAVPFAALLPNFVVCDSNKFRFFSYLTGHCLHKERLPAKIVACTFLANDVVLFADETAVVWRCVADGEKFVTRPYIHLPPDVGGIVLAIKQLLPSTDIVVVAPGAIIRYSNEFATQFVHGSQVYESESTRALQKTTIVQIISTVDGNFALHYRRNYIAEIYNYADLRGPFHVFKFAKEVEPTVSICYSTVHRCLLTVTKHGILSAWELDDHRRRKRRAATFDLRLNDDCQAIASYGDNKFVIITYSRIINFSLPTNEFLINN